MVKQIEKKVMNVLQRASIAMASASGFALTISLTFGLESLASIATLALGASIFVFVFVALETWARREEAAKAKTKAKVAK